MHRKYVYLCCFKYLLIFQSWIVNSVLLAISLAWLPGLECLSKAVVNMTLNKDIFKFKNKSTRLDPSVHFYQKVIGVKYQCMDSQEENGSGCEHCWKVFCYIFLNWITLICIIPNYVQNSLAVCPNLQLAKIHTQKDISLCNWNKIRGKNRSCVPLSTYIYYETSECVGSTWTWWILGVRSSLKLIKRECVYLLPWLRNIHFFISKYDIDDME